jgi:LysR family transcriptional regulator, transcriptional activator of nhaA
MCYCLLDTVVERFYAITAKRHFELTALQSLLEQYRDSGHNTTLSGR